MSGGVESVRSTSDLQGTMTFVNFTEDHQAQNNNSSNIPQLVGDLPQELFVEILQQVYLLRKKERTRPVQDANWTSPYQLVCRRWRDIVCSSPQFWQEIYVTRSSEWLNLCLTRCADTLVTVHVQASACSSTTFATLCHHHSSLRACYAHFDGDDKMWLSGLSSFLATPMPALEILSMDGRYHHSLDVAEAITRDLLPRLTKLTLHAASAPRDTAVYGSLRRLTLSESTWTSSYTDFLEVLRKCQDLEYLSLCNKVLYFFEYDLQVLDSGTKKQSASMPVVLPHLTTLKLCGPNAVVFRLLAAIHAPQATSIKLENMLLDPDEDEFGPDVALLLAPNPQLRYPFLSSPSSITIRCWDEADFRLHVRCHPRTSGLLYDLGREGNRYTSWTPYLEQNLTSIMDIFPVTSVATLEVEGRIDHVSMDVWQRVLQTFSGLRTLHLKGRGTMESFWLGLQYATLSSVEHGDGLCCPSLSQITTEARSGSRYQFVATPKVLDYIRDALGARAAHCSKPLKKLKLHLRYINVVGLQTEGLRGAFVEDVRALVEELEYHERRT